MGVAGSSTRISQLPRMPLSGVRSSWLTLARNWLLVRFAASAASFASWSACSTRARSDTSRSTISRPLRPLRGEDTDDTRTSKVRASAPSPTSSSEAGPSPPKERSGAAQAAPRWGRSCTGRPITRRDGARRMTCAAGLMSTTRSEPSSTITPSCMASITASRATGTMESSPKRKMPTVSSAPLSGKTKGVRLMPGSGLSPSRKSRLGMAVATQPVTRMATCQR